MESEKELKTRYKLNLDAEIMNDDVSRNVSSLIRDSSKVQEDGSQAYTSLKVSDAKATSLLPSMQLPGKKSQLSNHDSLQFAPSKKDSGLDNNLSQKR